jgi:hypothetical protein
MAKKKRAKKKAKKAKPAARIAKSKRAKSAKKMSKAPVKKRRVRGRIYVASVTSGSEASSLDPKGRLIDEREVEAAPHEHKGDLAGDLQGLSTTELFDSESVTELSEEGQDLEAELIEGIEEAPDADQGEVQVHRAPQKDVPEYKDRNRI